MSEMQSYDEQMAEIRRKAVTTATGWAPTANPVPAPCAGYATRAEALEAIAERLRNIDWCIGYELTSEQHVELDDIRSIAWALVSHTEKLRDDDEQAAKGTRL